MKFFVEQSFNSLQAKRLDLLVIGVREEEQALIPGAGIRGLSVADKKLVQEILKRKGIKAGQPKWVYLHGAPTAVVLVCERSYTEKKFPLLIRAVVRRAKKEGFSRIGIVAEDFSSSSLPVLRVAALIAENAVLADFDFAQYFKKAPAGGFRRVKEIRIFSLNESAAIKQVVKECEIVAEATNRARVLSNYPPDRLTPEGVAEAAREVAKEIPQLRLTIFDEKKLAKMGMHAILAVGKGSDNPPRLVILEYQGTNSKEKPVALVGKGVTFDSGGLNLKPAEGMGDMHLDMSGGAGVLYAIYAIAKLKLPINVIALIPTAENMPSGLSYHQSDIITAYGGKTIEIGNTDAEGRVIMADAIEYAKTKKPQLLITLATLTGTAIQALGTRMAALFVKQNHPLQDELEAIGYAAGDFVWPLPLWPEHERDVEGNFGDVVNTSRTNTRYGWAILGAAFLSKFAAPLPFAHIDMAPRMVADTNDELAKGSVGYGVRYFVEFARRWEKIKELL